jgi:Transposase DDE domain
VPGPQAQPTIPEQGLRLTDRPHSSLEVDFVKDQSLPFSSGIARHGGESADGRLARTCRLPGHAALRPQATLPHALPHGFPAHDTFERLFDRLDPVAFQGCFRAWIVAACEALHLPHVAIDGKSLRHAGSGSLGPLPVVSAWATANHLALGEVAVAEKSNAITAIPQLLELLDVTGALVTIDAMGCQKDIAQKIRDKQADYVLTVKENQPHLYLLNGQSFRDMAHPAATAVAFPSPSVRPTTRAWLRQ